MRDTYGCCSCRQLRAALPLTRGATSGHWGLPGIPSAGTPGPRGSRGSSPCPLALTRVRASLLGLGRGQRFGSRRGANTDRPGWARAALANLPRSPSGKLGQRCRLARGCSFLLYLNIAAVWERRHVRAVHFPRLVASAFAANLCQGLLLGSAAATRAPSPAHRHARPCPPLLPPPLPPALYLAEIRTPGTAEMPPAVREEARRAPLPPASTCPGSVSLL